MQHSLAKNLFAVAAWFVYRSTTCVPHACYISSYPVGVKLDDRLYVVDKLYFLKLDELIGDIQQSQKFGSVMVIIGIMEIQLRGKFHHHFLVTVAT